MKVQISEYERWPCYSVIEETEDTCGGDTACVDKRTYERWKRTIEKYNKVQKELQAILDKIYVSKKKSVYHPYDESCTCDREYEEHTCPFSEEINDDHESLCTCCPYHEQQCREDV